MSGWHRESRFDIAYRIATSSERGEAVDVRSEAFLTPRRICNDCNSEIERPEGPCRIHKHESGHGYCSRCARCKGPMTGE